MNSTNKYDDIINLPHHVSAVHPHMPIIDRAAQFSPFAALTGHESAIKETARLTEQRIELDEDSKVALDEKLHIISKNLFRRPNISITYFLADKYKDGGAYVTVSGNIKKMGTYLHCLVMDDGLQIPIDDILDINGTLFEALSDKREISF